MWRLVNLLAKDQIVVGSGVSNPELAGLMTNISNIVTGTVMPIIYIILGLVLIVKGALLGVQIVKAADEPQVRQEKINSLKWLVIGIVIAYGVTAVAHIFLGSDMFKNLGNSTAA